MRGIPGPVVAVVLAGGTSRRFGRDKLAEPLADEAPTLLDAALAALPAAFEVVVVGPERRTARPVRFVRENPAGGGPAAALVTGLRAALAEDVAAVVVLPADAPLAGRAAVELLARLGAGNDPGAVVATDEAGREQPLQLALSPAAARRLVAAATDGGQGASARGLLRGLRPAPEPVALGPDVLFDIDTPAQLAVWRAQHDAAVDAVVARVADLPARPPGSRPVVVALVGPSPGQRAMLAQALRLRTGATVLSTDDLPDQQVREVLETLLADLAADTGPAGRLVVLDGPDAVLPEVADLVDLTVPVAEEIGDVDGA